MVSEEELQEIFKKPAVREVACEVRFAPRLRIVPEVWRIQDKLAESYPQVGEETVPQTDGRLLHTYVFANRSEQKLIKVSQENFVVVFNAYTTFEDFKAEVAARIQDFSKQFEVNTFQRMGLRYVNHLEIPATDGISLLQRYVNAPVDFERFDRESIEQFLTEFRLKAGPHKLTVRGALIQVPRNGQNFLYILDLDCYSLGSRDSTSLSVLLDEFHYHIQVQFLEHVREEYKAIMRR